jgi:hypothetical protein
VISDEESMSSQETRARDMLEGDDTTLRYSGASTSEALENEDAVVSREVEKAVDNKWNAAGHHTIEEEELDDNIHADGDDDDDDDDDDNDDDYIAGGGTTKEAQVKPIFSRPSLFKSDQKGLEKIVQMIQQLQGQPVLLREIAKVYPKVGRLLEHLRNDSRIVYHPSNHSAGIFANFTSAEHNVISDEESMSSQETRARDMLEGDDTTLRYSGASTSEALENEDAAL